MIKAIGASFLKKWRSIGATTFVEKHKPCIYYKKSINKIKLFLNGAFKANFISEYIQQIGIQVQSHL